MECVFVVPMDGGFMNIDFKENIIPTLDDLIYLYNNVGWSNYTNNATMLSDAYHNSLYILTAWDKDKLIGVIRVVGDGYSIIYIQDIVVLKDYQYMGIGSKLLAEVLDKYNNVYQKVLSTDNEIKTKNFYEKMGFVPCEKYGCISFVKYNIV
jgi:ribosomal protein S18 acetylase RimI-like enzyme